MPASLNHLWPRVSLRAFASVFDKHFYLSRLNIFSSHGHRIWEVSKEEFAIGIFFHRAYIHNITPVYSCKLTFRKHSEQFLHRYLGEYHRLTVAMHFHVIVHGFHADNVGCVNDHVFMLHLKSYAFSRRFCYT